MTRRDHDWKRLRLPDGTWVRYRVVPPERRCLRFLRDILGDLAFVVIFFGAVALYDSVSRIWGPEEEVESWSEPEFLDAESVPGCRLRVHAPTDDPLGGEEVVFTATGFVGTPDLERDIDLRVDRVSRQPSFAEFERATRRLTVRVPTCVGECLVSLTVYDPGALVMDLGSLLLDFED